MKFYGNINSIFERVYIREGDMMYRETTPQKIFKEILSWVIPIIAAVIISKLLTDLLFLNAQIPSASMEPTIMTGDRVLANRIKYNYSDPERGDIIVFKYPVNNDKLYIKRIIGLPGEKVEIIQGEIYIDDSELPLEEPYLGEEWTEDNDGFIFEVPDNSYLVLGDNRNNSEDSRDWGTIAESMGMATNEQQIENFTYVSRDEILGKAMLRYWPISEFEIY